MHVNTSTYKDTQSGKRLASTMAVSGLFEILCFVSFVLFNTLLRVLYIFVSKKKNYVMWCHPAKKSFEIYAHMRKVCLSSEKVSVCVSVCVLCIFIVSPCVTIIYICVTIFIRISGLFLVRTSIGISVCLCIYLTICPLCTHEYQFFCCGK